MLILPTFRTPFLRVDWTVEWSKLLFFLLFQDSIHKMFHHSYFIYKIGYLFAKNKGKVSHMLIQASKIYTSNVCSDLKGGQRGAVRLVPGGGHLPNQRRDRPRLRHHRWPADWGRCQDDPPRRCCRQVQANDNKAKWTYRCGPFDRRWRKDLQTNQISTQIILCYNAQRQSYFFNL